MAQTISQKGTSHERCYAAIVSDSLPGSRIRSACRLAPILSAEEPGDGAKKLFNGKNLDGWV